MLKVLPQEESYEFNLSDLQKRLETSRYFGTLTLVFQDGHIVLMREERTLRPGQFDTFI